MRYYKVVIGGSDLANENLRTILYRHNDISNSLDALMLMNRNLRVRNIEIIEEGIYRIESYEKENKYVYRVEFIIIEIESLDNYHLRF